jgi:signal transduction histidine kinase
VQEVMTNAVRHAGARNLWIAVSDGADGIRVRARDDGRGAGAFTWGNGLRGMRERFEALAGRVDVETRAGGGFEVRGVMPRS